jgi:hypothetical protein
MNDYGALAERPMTVKYGSNRTETCPNVTSSTTSPTQTTWGLNLELRGETPVTNHNSFGPNAAITQKFLHGNFKLGVMKVRHKVMDGLNLGQNIIQWRDLVKSAVNVRVL